MLTCNNVPEALQTACQVADAGFAGHIAHVLLVGQQELLIFLYTADLSLYVCIAECLVHTSKS